MKKIILLIKNFFLSPASPASLFLTFNLFLFQPAVIYHANYSSLSYSLSEDLFWLMSLFILFYISFTLPALGKPKPWRIYYSAILMGLAFALWAASFFKGYQGQLDGKSFSLIYDTFTEALNAIILLVITILASLFAYFHSKLTKQIALILSASSCIFIVGTLLNYHKKITIPKTEILQKELTSFSKQKNVLVILLDTLQSDFFQEMLVSHPEWKAELNGFSYFPNAVSTAPSTLYSIPVIHSGKQYTIDEDVASYYDETVIKNSFVLAHVNKGYRGIIINPFFTACPKGIMCGDDSDIYYGKKAAKWESLLLVNLALFNSSPHFLKPYIYNQDNWLLKNLIPKTIISNNILHILTQHINTDANAPTIKFIHLFSTHPPVNTNANCNYIGTQAWNRNTAIMQDNCAMSQVMNVLKMLKNQQIYQKTTILIIADHGALLPFAGEPRIGAAANPLFLYKPFNASGVLKINSSPISLRDIPATICSETQDCQFISHYGQDIASLQKKELRTFHFHLDPRHGGVNDLPLGNFPVLEYDIKGPPQQLSSWYRVRPKVIPLKKDLAFSDYQFTDYYGLGWVVADQGVRWTSGPIADLLIPLPMHKKVSIQFHAQTHTNNKAQYLSVYINDVFLAKYPIYTQPSLITLNIPAEKINKKLTHITFKFSQWNLNTKTNQFLAVGFSGKLMININS
jgi:hypothetical protein